MALARWRPLGDAYLIVADDPWRAIACALQMNVMYKDILRYGMHYGRIASCVLGMHKLRHAYVGHPVNVAARLESSGEKGRIHVSLEFVELCQAVKGDDMESRVRFEERGVMSLKGVGEMKTYFVVVDEALKPFKEETLTKSVKE